MRKLGKNTTISTIALIFTLLISISIAVIPLVSARDVPTYAFITVSPNPIGVGQTAYIIMWLDKVPPIVAGSAVDRWFGFKVEVTKPDGTKETLGPYDSDPVGSLFLTYTPSELGTYNFQFSFPGQTVTAYGDYYEPSISMTASLTVQQEAIGSWPTPELPRDYWERPINAENREWWPISGNWLGTGSQIFDASGHDSSTQRATGAAFAPYTTAPNTAHIMWTKPVQFGGLIGGEFGGGGTSSYYTGHSYENLFTPPVIIQGRLYYNQRSGWSDWAGVACYDIRTGEQIWFKEGMHITNGQIYNYISPNQYGGIAYLWDRVGPIWHMYDAFTGNLILDIANATGGTVVMSPAGDMLVYVLQNNHLTMWNSSSFPQMLAGPLGSGTAGWQWRPPEGATLDWKDGIQWNVSTPEIPGQAISVISGDVILATTGGFIGALFSQTEIGYSTTTGEVLWGPINRTIPEAPTAWGFQGPIGEGVYTEYISNTLEWYGYDANTGQRLWGPTEPTTEAWGMYVTGNVIGCGKLFNMGADGLHAYDINTGEHLWDFNAGPSGLETVYPNFPFQVGGFTVADDKVFAVTGHSHTQPLFRGARLFAIDTETGEERWSISGWLSSGWMSPPAIADGYILTTNSYDNQLYCFGKGPSETTVTAPETAIDLGSSVLIRGSVTDQSSGAKGSPAISDEDMTAWMEYMYMQKPMPKDIKGVTVKLTSIDPNGNFQDLGEAVTDIDGNFGTTWMPPVPGIYQVTAEFEGSESYGSSYATTYFTVDPAPSVASMFEPDQQTAPLSIQSTVEAPFITAEIVSSLAIIAVACIIGIVAFWTLRKRN